jgi:hypothetical protein
MEIVMEAQWRVIGTLRETNRQVYQAIGLLVGEPGQSLPDPTIALMKRFYEKYPVLARAVHRDILVRDRLIEQHSSELAACE